MLRLTTYAVKHIDELTSAASQKLISGGDASTESKLEIFDKDVPTLVGGEAGVRLEEAGDATQRIRALVPRLSRRSRCWVACRPE